MVTGSAARTSRAGAEVFQAWISVVWVISNPGNAHPLAPTPIVQTSQWDEEITPFIFQEKKKINKSILSPLVTTVSTLRF